MDSTEESYKSDSNSKKYKTFLGIRSDRIIFIICILIASLFWLLIKLSNVYTVNYTFRVGYNNQPSSLRLTNIVDSTLDLSLTARGFAILKLNLFNDMETLNINLGNYNINKDGGSRYSIYTQELTTTLSELVNVDEKDLQLSRTALIFEMEETGVKRLPVIADYEIKFVDQFDLYSEVTIDPQNINVYGPQYILDSLSSIKTSLLLLNEVNANKKVKVGINNPFPDLLSFDNDEISLDFQIEKFTESELMVPVNLSNLKFNIKTFPSQVTVYYKVAQKDFNEVLPHQFNIIPIVDELNVIHAKKLPLKIDKQSDFVRNVRIVPNEVEFLIIK